MSTRERITITALADAARMYKLTANIAMEQLALGELDESTVNALKLTSNRMDYLLDKAPTQFKGLVNDGNK
jgi:hypothetical protein